MSESWIIQNLENALEVWNGKLAEIWQLITMSPSAFKGGAIWGIVLNVHGALQAIGYALLVLFFTTELSKMFVKSHELEEEIRTKLGAIGYEI